MNSVKLLPLILLQDVAIARLALIPGICPHRYALAVGRISAGYISAVCSIGYAPAQAAAQWEDIMDVIEVQMLLAARWN